jgi:predicted RNA-binding protein with PIN domain
MPLLIDGYNLMYGAGIVGDVRGPRGFERSRAALIGFVSRVVGDADRAGTTIVFDAAGAPPGLPATLDFEGILVRFARGYHDADELLEDLIAAHTSPRRLTVVSSDHRVQRAAKRRKAVAIDSDVWFAEAVRRYREGPAKAKNADVAKPTAGGDAEVKFWLDRIVGDAEIEKGLAAWNDVVPPEILEQKPEADRKPAAKKKKKYRRW